jgi:hypothetical protein
MPLHYYLPWVTIISIGLGAIAFYYIQEYKKKK